MRLAHADVVGEEDHVELAALRRARDLGVVGKIDPGVGLRVWVPPGRDMVAGGIEKSAEPELAFLPWHGWGSVVQRTYTNALNASFRPR